MNISLKRSTYFRKYGDIGYIENTAIASSKVVNEIGALFLSELTYEPRNINQIISGLITQLDGVDVETLKEDAIKFFENFIVDGFLADSDESLTENYTTFIDRTKLSKKEKQGMTTGIYTFNFFAHHPHIVGLHMEIISKCNERCIHCYIPHEKKDAQISRELMLRVLSECKMMGTLSLTISGGEPMLHPNFCEFLRIAKDFDFNVSVLSNLTLLNDDIVKMLAYRHPTCVCVSVYSMQREIHDAITMIDGSHDRTINNILVLLRNNIPVRINCVVMKQNKDSFHEVIEWGREHQCAVTVDYSLTARNDGTTDNLENRLTGDELQQVIEKYISVDKNYQTSVNSMSMEWDDDERVCGVGMTFLAMNAKGDVYPCVGWEKFKCGNLNDSTLYKIWEESPQLNFLRKLRMKDFTQCKNCLDREYCHICISANSNENQDGDIFKISKVTCDAARIRHKVIEKYREQYKDNL